MAKKALVIVESPAKAKTIQKYLGREYIVKASVGHVKDLPKSKLGVDPKKGFAVDYQVIPAKAKIIEELRKFSKLVPTLYLATDPDREGEAIAWHIREELKARGKKIHRVLFNSITKSSVLEAMSHPQELDINKFNAQQARRVLDRLVGYKISPLLWDKVKRGISAGRVQSVALRLVVDREVEIKAFKPVEYWQVKGIFSDALSQVKVEEGGGGFSAHLFKMDGKDPVLSSQAETDALLDQLKQVSWEISSIEQKERTRKATPPFITSRLQQDASRKLGFSAKKTMALAQKLYEGVDLGDMGTSGIITYMRTDSVRIEPVALQALREYIEQQFGKAYLPEEPNVYKSKKSAQDAHEAIRPTSMEYSPEKVQPFLDKDEYRLYLLIWNRFVASQMTPVIYDQTAVDICNRSNPTPTTGGGNTNKSSSDRKGALYQFRATGSVVKFAGFTAVYLESAEDGDKADNEQVLKLPVIHEGEPVSNQSLTPTQHFTQGPARYSDASLIRDLEEKGIGRPSTYATILSNLQDREYVEKRETRYYPSELGTVVTELLVGSFPDILNSEFTAAMEDQLDDIAEGTVDWKKTLSKFWKPFEKTLEKAKEHMKNVKRQEVPTDLDCVKCGHKMVIKWGKLGSFLACSNYPECKNTQDFKKDEQGLIVIIPKEFTDKKCQKCEIPMVIKSGKFGKFLACSDYPNCKFTQPVTIGIHCPLCADGEIAQKQSKYRRLFYSCNQWPKCTFALWDKPIQKPCPQCHFPLLTEKVTKRAGLMHKCSQKECGFIDLIDPDFGKEPLSGESKAAVA